MAMPPVSQRHLESQESRNYGIRHGWTHRRNMPLIIIVIGVNPRNDKELINVVYGRSLDTANGNGHHILPSSMWVGGDNHAWTSRPRSPCRPKLECSDARSRYVNQERRYYSTPVSITVGEGYRCDREAEGEDDGVTRAEISFIQIRGRSYADPMTEVARQKSF